MEKKYKLLLGDCLDKLKELDDNSIDSIVTDPPYGIGFMGKAWDTFDTKNVNKANEDASKSFDKTKENKQNNPNLKGRKNAPIGGKATFAGTYDLTPKGSLAYQQFCEEWGKECLRVLKPGGHLLSSCSPRMYHRMTVGLEDAGFEIRDQIMWVYGSGFPKSHNIGKNIEKIKVGGIKNLKQIGTKLGIKVETGTSGFSYSKEYVAGKSMGGKQIKGQIPVYEISNDYEGWGTALKPAHEPICMARKPLSEKTVAENVLEWGTGGINIDGCRVDVDMNIEGSNAKRMNKTYSGSSAIFGQADGDTTFDGYDKGRFPANLILDKEAGKILDEQSGNKTGQRGVVKGTEPSHNKVNSIYGDYSMVDGKYVEPMDALGGASRFFYCPKTSKKDRNEGLEHIQPQQIKGRDEGQDKTSIAYKARPTERKNIHPTVKPTDLMQYLIRLVTPKDGIVLDPFMGSGSTGKAAMREGFGFVGIERDEEYMEIAKSRIEYEHNKRKFF